MQKKFHIFMALLSYGQGSLAESTEPFCPNSETVAAMKTARCGELIAVGNINNLLEILNAGTERD